MIPLTGITDLDNIICSLGIRNMFQRFSIGGICFIFQPFCNNIRSGIISCVDCLPYPKPFIQIRQIIYAIPDIGLRVKNIGFLFSRRFRRYRLLGISFRLTVGIFSTILSIVVGIVLGAIAGFYSGATDNIIMRVLDVFMAIPGLLLPIAIIAAFGTSTANITFALGVGAIPSYARTIRASVLQLQDSEFVEAARACGAKDNVIIFKHILPNSMAPLIIRSTLGIGAGVTAVSSLSYLGLGIAPHIPEWGNILKAGSSYLETNPYMAIFPGFAIVILVLAFNFLGDGLRDALDPKLK